jgi:hypothetical protein
MAEARDLKKLEKGDVISVVVYCNAFFYKVEKITKRRIFFRFAGSKLPRMMKSKFSLGFAEDARILKDFKIVTTRPRK